MVKDEIVSLASGNIQHFEVISDIQMPNGNVASTVKATVSVSNLTSFVESKGVKAEFKGNLFAFNIKQQLLNEQSELKAMENVYDTYKEMLPKIFDYDLKVSNPVANGQKWTIPVKIFIKTNQNIEQLNSYLFRSFSAIGMSTKENEDYKNLGKETFGIPFYKDHSFENFNFRNEKTLDVVVKMIQEWTNSMFSFKISNGVNTVFGQDKDLFHITDDKKDKNKMAIREATRIYLDQFSTQKALQGYGWYELTINPFKIITEKLELKENQFLGIIPLTKYTYKGITFGTNEEVSIIIPNPNTQVGHLLYEDNLTLDEINKITDFKISKN